MKRNKHVGGAPAYMAGTAVFAGIIGGIKNVFARGEKDGENA